MKRSLIAALLSCIVVFGFGEVAARWVVAAHGDALDLTRPILEPDAILGWKQRANLSTAFMGKPLQTDAEGFRIDGMPHSDAQKTILILGPSSAFGWGAEGQDTYASQLQTLLGTSSTHVINAGEIGYSSYQGAKLFSQIAAQTHPSVVVIAYGVNDLDYNRFYFQSGKSDEQEFTDPKPSVEASTLKLVYSSALCELVLKVADRIRGVFVSSHTQTVRVSPEEFAANLSAIIDRAQGMGARVILLTTASNLKLAPGEKDEPSRVAHDIPLYNAALKEVATQKHVSVGDIDAWFAGKNRGDLFIDPIHFSKEGGALVAHGLAAILAGL